MVTNRRVSPRPYLFELFVLANFLLIAAITVPNDPFVLTSIRQTARAFIPTLTGYALAGVLVRAIIAAVRGNLKAYLRILRSPGWLVDTARLVIVGSAMVHTYFCIKLIVPLVHPRLFDQQLWNLDQAMFAGYSPNILFIEIFSAPSVMRFIDMSYARIFFISMTVAFVFFLSDASRRLRVAFMTGNSFLWIMGAWLYMLLPSLGPAFRFPDVWMPLASSLPITQQMQALLARNYNEVLRMASGTSQNVQLMLGVAAFPSLHVGFQTFAFLWMRRLWIYGQIVFGVFAFVILIGSVVTGWHYLLDGLAGIVLAAASYLVGARLWNLREWLRLRAAMRRRSS
jgi:hypothetical protein